MPTKEKLWTYRDYLELNDGKRYEIMEGELLMAPAPMPYHQEVSRNLGFLMWDFVKKRRLGVIFYAPIDVVFDEHNVLQPDIVFVSKERRDIIGEKAIHGAPDLVVEVISPSTLGRDTVRKRNIYECFGVREFWIVYPDMRCIEVLSLKGERYRIHSEGCLEKDKEVVSHVIKGFKAELESVFQSYARSE